jgi:hypothetical protein
MIHESQQELLAEIEESREDLGEVESAVEALKSSASVLVW